MALSDGFTDCAVCGSTEDVEKTHNGKCLACAELTVGPKGPTVEVPVAVLRKLTSQANTRHPTVCHEDAPRFRNVLERELDVELDKS